MKVDTILIEQA